MNIEVRENLKLHLYGFSAQVPNLKFGETGVALSGRMWDIVKKNNLPHNGINIWVYDNQSSMFSGVEIEPAHADDYGMEVRDLRLKKYAWYKHVGPYQELMEANDKMRQELQKRGLEYGPPSLEVYGHHGPDENKLETEIIYTIY
jgi:predicted transcriptional regulator YdeE